jgi:hypothetical protein
MDQADILKYLFDAPVEEAFRSATADREALAKAFFLATLPKFLEQGLDVESVQLVSLELVFSDYIKYPPKEGRASEVNPHIRVMYDGATYHLWGAFFLENGAFRGTCNGIEREYVETDFPDWSWREVFDRLGLAIPQEFERYAKLAAEEGRVYRAMKPSRALIAVEVFLRPDELPFLGNSAGDYLAYRFDPKTGEPVGYFLVIHDDCVSYPMGDSLAAALHCVGLHEHPELRACWEAAAAEVAGDSMEHFELVRVAMDLMYEWGRWKFKIFEGVEVNSEELCREWLEKWDSLDTPVLRKNSRCQTITAFAAARLGESQRAFDAAVAALRLPARDGDWERHALRLMDALGLKEPADLRTLCQCVRGAPPGAGVQ